MTPFPVIVAVSCDASVGHKLISCIERARTDGVRERGTKRKSITMTVDDQQQRERKVPERIDDRLNFIGLHFVQDGSKKFPCNLKLVITNKRLVITTQDVQDEAFISIGKRGLKQRDQPDLSEAVNIFGY